MNSESVPVEKTLTRRTFFNRALLASATLAFAASEFNAQDIYREDVLLEYPPLKISGAESLLPGSFLYFSYPTSNDEAVLVRAPDGQYFAYARKCAHRGCSVDFSSAQRCLICPCHKGAYDARTGFVLFGPPLRPLDPIILQMRSGGQVWAVGKTVGNRNPNA